jgi:hypothetical protein
MASDLVKRVQGKAEGRKLEIIVNDVMKTELPPVDVCISNTPYQVSDRLYDGSTIVGGQRLTRPFQSDILTPRLQAPLATAITKSMRTHVPKRIRPSSSRTAR